MGLLDQLAGQLAGATGTQQRQSTANNALLGGLIEMMQSNGGLPALLEKMQSNGLSEQVASWIGRGDNLPISGTQIADAVGAEQVDVIAAKAGLDPAQVSSGMAQLLPQLIDHLTPNGEVPHGDLMSQGMNLLKARFFP